MCLKTYQNLGMIRIFVKKYNISHFGYFLACILSARVTGLVFLRINKVDNNL